LPGECSVDFEEYLGDAYCDVTGGYNVAACSWDGGDCCIYTCTESSAEEEQVYSCGQGGWDCKDDTTCSIALASWLSDGYCDDSADGYNTEILPMGRW
jgi:hypothetical protein